MLFRILDVLVGRCFVGVCFDLFWWVVGIGSGDFCFVVVEMVGVEVMSLEM